jgi:hypothetical protein
VDVVAACCQRARQIEGVKPPVYDDRNFHAAVSFEASSVMPL